MADSIVTNVLQWISGYKIQQLVKQNFLSSDAKQFKAWTADPTAKIPFNTYRRAIIVIPDTGRGMSETDIANLPKKLEDIGVTNGVRILNVTPLALPAGQVVPNISFGQAYLFTAYLASDVVPVTVGGLAAFLGGGVTMSKTDVSFVEKQTLDAAWIARKSAGRLIDDANKGIDKNVEVKLPWTTIIATGVLLIGVAALILRRKP